MKGHKVCSIVIQMVNYVKTTITTNLLKGTGCWTQGEPWHRMGREWVGKQEDVGENNDIQWVCLYTEGGEEISEPN